MENLINQENLEDLRDFIESKIADVPGSYILIGAVGSLLLSSYLTNNGHPDAGSLIGKLAIPIAGIGLAKYKDVLAQAAESLAQKATGTETEIQKTFETA
ncbi:hypothetical protein [Flavobacterium sp. DG2-3]|uniref:hypothetical protein n=1 Tax=Flavobacterium sp. DG2-3 TaxID=3068317 RepID=UPI00273EA38E|nr:hypothetical protein [Flavobacterium sp. DG2-3]MDP5200374.1 hypothetical protein [Flavobacterium sp. DG2-3]